MRKSTIFMIPCKKESSTVKKWVKLQQSLAENKNRHIAWPFYLEAFSLVVKRSKTCGMVSNLRKHATKWVHQVQKFWNSFYIPPPSGKMSLPGSCQEWYGKLSGGPVRPKFSSGFPVNSPVGSCQGMGLSGELSRDGGSCQGSVSDRSCQVTTSRGGRHGITTHPHNRHTTEIFFSSVD